MLAPACARARACVRARLCARECLCVFVRARTHTCVCLCTKACVCAWVSRYLGVKVRVRMGVTASNMMERKRETE